MMFLYKELFSILFAALYNHQLSLYFMQEVKVLILRTDFEVDEKNSFIFFDSLYYEFSNIASRDLFSFH